MWDTPLYVLFRKSNIFRGTFIYILFENIATPCYIFSYDLRW